MALFAVVFTHNDCSWSDSYRRNATQLPVAFVRSATLTDLLAYSTLDLLRLLDVVGGVNGTMDSADATSEWEVLSTTYGYVFQIFFTIFSLLNAFMALASVVTTVGNERREMRTRSCVQLAKRSITVATVCLLVELIANLLRAFYFAVDPVLMWGTLPVEVAAFFETGFLTLTLFSNWITCIFWLRVVLSPPRAQMITLSQVWIAMLVSFVIMVPLEFLDGIIWVTAPSTRDDFAYLQFVQQNLLGALCFVVCCTQLVSGALLTRKFRAAASIRSERSRLGTHSAWFGGALCNGRCYRELSHHLRHGGADGAGVVEHSDPHCRVAGGDQRSHHR